VSFTLAIAHKGLLPSARCKASAFSGTQNDECRIILMTTTIHLSGLNTEPVSLSPPASYSGYPVCTWISLLSWWLPFGQVGLSRYAITHWVTVTNFIPIYVDSQGLGFTLARASGLLGPLSVTLRQFLYSPADLRGAQRQFSLPVGAVSGRHVFFFLLLGYGNYLAVFKGYIPWQMEL
jgi:hypothetical protein